MGTVFRVATPLQCANRHVNYGHIEHPLGPFVFSVLAGLTHASCTDTRAQACQA